MDNPEKFVNIVETKPKRQSRMDNPEKLVNIG
jgi:hypothetical protein